MAASCSVDTLRAILADELYVPAIRGSGSSQFLFIEKSGRAVEASINDDGRWWIEVWERSDDEDASPVAEHWADSDIEALNAINGWLN